VHERGGFDAPQPSIGEGINQGDLALGRDEGPHALDAVTQADLAQRDAFRK
jgi:hypothetical protein